MADLAALAEHIRGQIGHDRVVDDRDIMASYEVDWTGRYRGRAGLVVRPVDTDELSAAIGLCASAGVEVVPQGGNTGLVGGSIPRRGGVVLSTQRMTNIEVGGTNTEVTVDAGATLARVQQHARDVGMGFAVDLASRDSATIGGMIATNAGGIHVVRWGRMRAQILGLEVVMSDGRVLDRLFDDSADLTGHIDLFAGSEGTLGVISRARLRLVPDEQAKVVVLLAFDTAEHAAMGAVTLKSQIPKLDAVEYFRSNAIDLVRKHRGLRAPFGESEDAYLLVEVAGPADPEAVLLSALQDLPGITHSAVGVEPGQRRSLWELRESITDAISAAGVPQKYDLWLPPQEVPALEGALASLALETGVRIVVFGHIAEGSLHVNVLGLDPEDRSIEDRIYRLVLGLGGSPISEHGVGSSKVRWHREVLSPVDFEAMQDVKRRLDPANLLNPGVLLPSPEAWR